MDLQKDFLNMQIAYEKNCAIRCNYSYEELKAQLDRSESLFGTRYLEGSPRHENWLLWVEAWQAAKEQAVPKGFVLVPKEPNLEFKDRLRSYLDSLWMGEWGCDWDGFICVNGIDPNHVWKIVTDTKAMIEAQGQSHE